MAHPKLEYTKTEVNKAGGILSNFSGDVEWEKLDWALDVLSNWRGCHSYPVNTFQATLRSKLKFIDSTALVAQRLKRTPSVILKLRRFNRMQLSRMQDIGGLRAVVKNLRGLRALEKAYTRSNRFSHELVSTKDYVTNPKADGYRSIHIVYRYKNLKNSMYDGLQIELQMRTRLQHSWATAVETIGIMTNQALKSNQGTPEWLDFFRSVGAAFALMEKTPLIPGFEEIPEKKIRTLVEQQENKLHVLERLEGFSKAVHISGSNSRGKYQLIVLNSQTKEVKVTSFSENQLEEAKDSYMSEEKKAQLGVPLEVVLVSTGSIGALKKAYPNYFLDTHDFIRNVRKFIDASK